MEVFIAIAVGFVLAITAWRAYEHVNTRRALRALTTDPVLLLAAPEVDGHAMHGGWHFVDVRSDADQRYERWTYRTTVQGVLPEWLMMDYCASRPVGRGGSRAFLPEALFGRERVEGLPETWQVRAERGDLVLQSDLRYLVKVPSRPVPEVDATAQDLARAFIQRGPAGLRDGLAEAVEVQGEAEALRLLGRHFPEAEVTRTLTDHSLTHEIAAVRVVAARLAGEAGHGVLADTALELELPAPVRREACRALARREDFEALLTVATEAAEGVEDVIAEALEPWPDARVEGVVLPFLSHDSTAVIEATAHALAQRGTAASISALKAVLARQGRGPVKTALVVAIDLIRERASGERGGLALVEDPKPCAEAGRISLPPRSQGRLSPPHEDTADG